MNRLRPTTVTTRVEEEVNNEIKNLELDIRDVVVFVEINEYNLVPLDTYINKDNKIVIEDNIEAKDKDIYVGTRHQFLYKRYTVNSNTINFELDEAFKTGWNPKYYVVFRNGYKLNPNMYRVRCPSLDNQYGTKSIFTLVRFEKGDTLDIFYIESDNDYFVSIDTSGDLIIKSYMTMATSDDQYTIEIPYPYESYDKSHGRFFVFDLRSNSFLKLNEDYTVHTSGMDRYISMSEEKKLSNNQRLIFLFPYCIADLMDNDISQELSNIVITISRGSGISAGRYITFSPVFSDYTLTKDNMLLFYDDEIIDPSTFSISNNSTIMITTDLRDDYKKYYILTISEYDYNETENPLRLLKMEEQESKARLY